MAAVTGLSHEHGAALTEASGQHPGLGKGGWSVKEQIRFHAIRQNRGEGIEECPISQIGAVEAVLHRRTPDHLMRATSHGKNRQRAFRPEQLVSPPRCSTPQNHLRRQAALPVAVLNHVDV